MMKKKEELVYMYEDLNRKQIEILEFIKSESRKRGFPPSVREICAAVRLKSTSTVHSHLSVLESQGYIRRDPTKPRAIEVIDSYQEVELPRKEIMNIPILGEVAAGTPIMAAENLEDTFPIAIDFFHQQIDFALKVKGDSMIEAGILDGDIIFVNSKNTASNGEIVVALIEDEVTVKRFFKEKNHYRLQPENQTMSPIISQNVKILGLVRGVFRQV